MSAFLFNLGLRFEHIATVHADRPALSYPADGTRVTYGELRTLTDAVARALLGARVRQGDVVAMFHDKSPMAFAAMLACLRLGVIYTNLDPDSPWERLRKILGTCEPRLMINSFAMLPHARELADAGFTDVLHLRRLEEHAAGDGVSDAALPDLAAVAGGSPAYIMFTSGSTGMPKGATISHANLLWFIGWSTSRFGITSDDVLSNLNPIYFDNSVFDFYTAIFSGASLVPITAAQTSEPKQVVKLIADGGCTIWFSVPSLLVYLLTTRALRRSDFPQVRSIIFGGEGFPKSKLRQLYDLFGDRASLENVYGPTECTCICSAHPISAADFEDMQSLATLGPMAHNFDYEILPIDDEDADFGELCLRGPHVGLGYFNDPERTSTAFIQNPRHSRYSDPCYRTGDLVRRDTRGWLDFKGRADFQIKHLGYRIELEEIEAALGTLDGVTETAVVYQKLGDGLGQIIGFAATSHAVDPAALVAAVATIVPPYMVPRRVVLLDSLPKNANGKIDRVALHARLTNS